MSSLMGCCFTALFDAMLLPPVVYTEILIVAVANNT